MVMAETSGAAAAVAGPVQKRCTPVGLLALVMLQSESIVQPSTWHVPLLQTLPEKVPTTPENRLQSWSVWQGRVHDPLTHFERMFPCETAHCASVWQEPATLHRLVVVSQV